MIDPDLHLAPRELLDEGDRAEAKRLGGDDPARRRELRGQLDRLRDLYVLDDLTKNQYVMKRQAIEDELSRHAPPIDPALAQAEAVLDDFARLWEEEPSPLERRKLIATLLDRVWQDGGRLVAVRPGSRSCATSGRCRD